MGILTKKKTTDDAQRCNSEVVIENRNGLHARPAAMFVKISSRYRAEVWVEKDGELAKARNSRFTPKVLMLTKPWPKSKTSSKPGSGRTSHFPSHPMRVISFFHCLA
jgi:phosphotransferase system HPr (HPr) family protein